MTVEVGRVPLVAPRPEGKGLRAGAIGFWDALAIGLDSTASAYSIAAILGTLIVVAGTKAPAVMVLSFIPMLLTAGAFYYMARVDQDCGTTFAWATRTVGPSLGWLGGWAILVTAIVVIGAQADVAIYYLFDLVGADRWRDTRWAVVVGTVCLVMLMTWISALQINWSARVQRVLAYFQVSALLLFVAMSAWRIAIGDVDAGALVPQWSWLNPSDLGGQELVAGLMLGVFAYWGWESALNLVEESRENATAPGRAGLVATVVLLVAYVGSAIAVLGVVGDAFARRYDDDAGLLGEVASRSMGSWSVLVLLAVISAGVGSTQTTILPAARTALSMASTGSFPRAFRRVDGRSDTPIIGTWVLGVAAAVWYVAASVISENFLYDSVSALAILVAFYYALTAIACVVYWRREWRRGFTAFAMVGLGPAVGAASLLFLMVRAAMDMADPGASYTGSSFLGVGAPLAIAGFIAVTGVAGLVVARVHGSGGFFRRPAGGAVDPALAGEVLDRDR